MDEMASGPPLGVTSYFCISQYLGTWFRGAYYRMFFWGLLYGYLEGVRDLLRCPARGTGTHSLPADAGPYP
jgi:hypothetical protein